MNGIPHADVEGVYSTLEEANRKVRDVARAYAARIRMMINMFGWGAEGAALCSSDCQTRPDGTLYWGGLRELKTDGSDPATSATQVAVYKKVIDEAHADDIDEDLLKRSATHPPKISSYCILDPPASELKAYAPHSQQLYLVITTSTITGSDDHALNQIHGTFNTVERANLKTEELEERFNNIDKRIEGNYRQAFNKTPWFLEDGYESLWKEGTRADGAKWWVRPIRSPTEAKDKGFMIISTRILVQAGDEKPDNTSANTPSFESGQEIFIVAETASLQTCATPHIVSRAGQAN